MKKILSVSVAAYNLEDLISENLESWINVDVMDKIEVLIIDDGSKDNTAKIVEQYEKKYPQTFKLIKQKNSGPGSTVNSGIKHASGKYFRMVDGDDWVRTENLAEYIMKLENTDADIVLTNYEIYDNSAKQIIENKKTHITPGEKYNFDDVSSKIKPQMHNVTYKTKILKDNNIILDNGFYTDVEYLLLPLKYIKSIIYYDIEIYVYRIGQANQSVSISSMQKNIDMHKIVLNRMIQYFEENKEEISKEKKEYLIKQIATVADAHIGTLLTFEMNKETRNKIKDFNKELKKKSRSIYNMYKKSKKVRIVLWSNYTMCSLLSKMYIKKLSK